MNCFLNFVLVKIFAELNVADVIKIELIFFCFSKFLISGMIL